MHHQSGGGQFIARTVREPVHVGLPFGVSIVEFPDAVALTADFGGPLRSEPLRLNDRRVVSARQIERVSAPWVTVQPYVFVARSVACLARDAKLRGSRVHDLCLGQPASCLQVKARLALRGVARDAGAVPAARLRERPCRWTHQCRRPRDPAALGDQVLRRELAEKSAASGCIPVHLLMMRARRHDNLTLDARSRLAAPVPVWIIKCRPELIAAALQLHRPTWNLVHLNAREISDDRFRTRNLRHRAMVRAVPAGIFARVATLARIGRRVAALRYLNGPVGDLMFGRRRFQRGDRDPGERRAQRRSDDNSHRRQ